MKQQDPLRKLLKRLDAKETSILERMLCHAEKYGIMPEELKEKLAPEIQADFDKGVTEVLRD